MSRAAVSPKVVNPEKTVAVVNRALSDVRHAARPSKRSLRNVFSWAVAVGAGAAVAWKSIRATSTLGESDLAVRPRDAGEHQPRGTRTAPGERETGGRSGAGPRAGRAAGRARRGDEPSRRGSPQSAPTPRADREECDDDGARPGSKVTGAGALIKELWCRFQRDECMTRAQALAFIGILSLGPVLLFALAALGFVIHDTGQVESFVHGLVAQMLPGREASDAANNLIAQTHIVESAHTLMAGKWWAAAVGVLSLLWAAIGLFVGASDPMNAAWDVRETRGFVKLRLVALGVFIGSGLLFLLSLVPSSLPSIIGKVDLPVIGALPPGLWWVEAAAWVLAILVDAAMFTAIYRYLPNAEVSWKSAMFGGLVAGVLWELFKKAFEVYLAHFANFNKLYGTLGGAVLLVTWIWYSCVLLLVGAIACKMYKEHAEEGGVVKTGGEHPPEAPASG